MQAVIFFCEGKIQTLPKKNLLLNFISMCLGNSQFFSGHATSYRHTQPVKISCKYTWPSKKISISTHCSSCSIGELESDHILYINVFKANQIICMHLKYPKKKFVIANTKNKANLKPIISNKYFYCYFITLIAHFNICIKFKK